LIGTDIIREIIVKCSKLVRAIITHPSASSSRGYRELDAIIHGSNSHLGVIFMDSRSRRGGSEESEGCSKKLEHLYR
jgi:hypothetical protein